MLTWMHIDRRKEAHHCWIVTVSRTTVPSTAMPLKLEKRKNEKFTQDTPLESWSRRVPWFMPATPEGIWLARRSAVVEYVTPSWDLIPSAFCTKESLSQVSMHTSNIDSVSKGIPADVVTIYRNSVVLRYVLFFGDAGPGKNVRQHIPSYQLWETVTYARKRAPLFAKGPFWRNTLQIATCWKNRTIHRNESASPEVIASNQTFKTCTDTRTSEILTELDGLIDSTITVTEISRLGIA